MPFRLQLCINKADFGIIVLRDGNCADLLNLSSTLKDNPVIMSTILDVFCIRNESNIPATDRCNKSDTNLQFDKTLNLWLFSERSHLITMKYFISSRCFFALLLYFQPFHYSSPWAVWQAPVCWIYTCYLCVNQTTNYLLLISSISLSNWVYLPEKLIATLRGWRFTEIFRCSKTNEGKLRGEVIQAEIMYIIICSSQLARSWVHW